MAAPPSSTVLLASPPPSSSSSSPQPQPQPQPHVHHHPINHIAPIPPDARWDPSCLPTDDDDDDEPRWTELQVAARQGDLGLVTQILSRCDDDDDDDDDDEEARRERKAAVVNAPPVGWYGQTALQAACLLEHVEVVRVLLEAGADIAAPGGNNIYMNAFELACGTGRFSETLCIFFLFLMIDSTSPLPLT